MGGVKFQNYQMALAKSHLNQADEKELEEQSVRPAISKAPASLE